MSNWKKPAVTPSNNMPIRYRMGDEIAISKQIMANFAARGIKMPLSKVKNLVMLIDAERGKR